MSISIRTLATWPQSTPKVHASCGASRWARRWRASCSCIPERNWTRIPSMDSSAGSARIQCEYNVSGQNTVTSRSLMSDFKPSFVFYRMTAVCNITANQASWVVQILNYTRSRYYAFRLVSLLHFLGKTNHLLPF